MEKLHHYVMKNNPCLCLMTALNALPVRVVSLFSLLLHITSLVSGPSTYSQEVGRTSVCLKIS